MLIVQHSEAYFRPHLHIGKGQSFHIIEGHARVVTFHDSGEIATVTAVGANDSGRPFYWRIEEDIWYAFVVESEWLVFFETTAGPFDPGKIAYPDWSPTHEQPADCAAWSRELSALTQA
jgi:cupin fold WbuC family metalloprotein